MLNDCSEEAKKKKPHIFYVGKNERAKAQNITANGDEQETIRNRREF